MVSANKIKGVSDIKTILASKGLDRNLEHWRDSIEAVTAAEVETALGQCPGLYNLDKLVALVSPVAEDYLEEMAQMASKLKIQRFGKTIQLYAPLYLSNFCTSSCLYCAFNVMSRVPRNRLTIPQALAEADVLAAEGFRHILLVSGEDRKFITTEYLCELAEKLRTRFSSISMEIYQMSRDEYTSVFAAGIDGVTLYQETYDRNAYAYYHPAGTKADYDYRLSSHDRAASAGMRRLGLGVLLGLTDFRTETLALAEHARYLMKRYWRARVSFSFARIRPAHGVGERFEHLLSDKNLVQMILALRLCFADAELVLSTRERAELRDRLVNLGITRMSAGSKTNPGGYSGKTDAVEQFRIDDTRTPAEIAEMLKSKGLEPVWKDWDATFTTCQKS